MATTSSSSSSSSTNNNSSTVVALAGFAIGSAVTLAGVWCFQHFDFQQLCSPFQSNGNTKKKQIPKHNNNNINHGLPAEIRQEQLSRHTLFFGEDGMTHLQNASIVVVGVGGVGSHVAHMLGRAGVGHIRLIDFDQVTVSSLNRHACATLKDVGISKVMCMKQFLEQVCPDPRYLKVEAIAEMYTEENGPRLLALSSSSSSLPNKNKKWNMVIDAIDDVPTKAALLAYCLEQNIRVLSCMGAGGKSDVTRLHISDLRTAAKDPLASKLRQYLKKRLPPAEPGKADYMETMEQLAIIYSSEKPVVKLADFTPHQKSTGVHTFGAVDGMRIRVLPVLGTMPALMGQSLAAMAICELGGKPISSPVTGERLGRNVRNRLYQHLKRREDAIAKAAISSMQQQPLDAQNLPNKGIVLENGQWIGPLQVDQDDMCYLMEIWRNRCAVTGDRLGTVLELVRWDLTKPSLCNNLVLMSTHALKQYDATTPSSSGNKDFIPESVRKVIEDRLASCNVDGHYG